MSTAQTPRVGEYFDGWAIDHDADRDIWFGRIEDFETGVTLDVTSGFSSVEDLVSFIRDLGQSDDV